MTDHLTSAMLDSLADGELSSEQLAKAQDHLENCCACTSRALGQALLKTTVARSGHRYSPPPDLAERLKLLIANETQKPEQPSPEIPPRPTFWVRSTAFAGWVVAAILLVAGVIVLQRNFPGNGRASSERAVFVTEICDLHVAALAESAPMQVISTDRHTVKPWFQGKLPFTFNLPDQSPPDVKLEGANLTYFNGQPVAQLFYSIGRHRVSVFLGQRRETKTEAMIREEHSGFHLAGFSTDELEAVAISDVDPARLIALVDIIRQAQSNARK